MNTQVPRRVISDVRAVCGVASPRSATRWLGSLITHFPECVRTRSLVPADRAWTDGGASFRTRTGIVALPDRYTRGAREIYCRNVYLRTGLTLPSDGWVLDLGANHGLFSTWAAVSGAQVIAVEAQPGFARVIKELAAHNGVADRVHVETAMVTGSAARGETVGVLADDRQWQDATYGGGRRPEDVSIPQLMSTYLIDRIAMLKMDIEGGEFSVFAADEDVSWLDAVDQLAMEVHPQFGDPLAMIDRLQDSGFKVALSDNDGHRVTAMSAGLTYAYCLRS